MAGRPPDQRDAAKAYFLEHPEAKDKDVVAALNITKATVARARWDLIDQKLLLPESQRRRQPAREAKPATPKPIAALPTPESEGDALLTDEDLRALDAEDVTDEKTRTSILKALRKIAFGRGINHETAMSAMALWVKLKDQAAVKELGPGNPLTYAAAKERLMILMKACGFELVYDAFNELFVPKEATNEGQLSTQHSEVASGNVGTSPAS